MTEPDDLTTTAGDLVREVQTLSARLRSTRRNTVILAVSLVLDLTLTIVMATVLNHQADQNHKIQQALSQNYVTAQQQRQTRIDVLCPLYQLFIASVDDPHRTDGMTPDQKARSDRAAVAIHAQYARLGCPSTVG